MGAHGSIPAWYQQTCDSGLTRVTQVLQYWDLHTCLDQETDELGDEVIFPGEPFPTAGRTWRSTGLVQFFCSAPQPGSSDRSNGITGYGKSKVEGEQDVIMSWGATWILS